MTGPTTSNVRGSLRGKLVRLLVGMLVVSSLGILSAVVWIQVQANQRSLEAIEQQIRNSIEDKGKVLTKNHAIALKGLALDNAFTAINELVAQATNDDSDLVYGLFLSEEGDAIAYHGPNTKQQTRDDEQSRKARADAWKVLGLKDADVHLKGLTAAERHVFGEDLIEFAMPVADGDELLGTIRYGLSQERTQHALSDARELSSATLTRTLWTLGAIVLLTTLLTLVLSLRSSGKITEPLRILSDAASSLASGNRQLQVAIHSGDELEQLGATFNRMVVDLNTSYAELESLNRDLESRVLQRTEELSSRNQAMRLVLDNVEQGLATLQLDGTLADERSLAFDRLLLTSPGPCKFDEAVGGDDERFRMTCSLAWDQVVEGFMPLELTLSQMPRRLQRNERHLALEYLPVMAEGELKSVLLIVSDVTSEVERAAQEQEQRQHLQIFKQITRDRYGFIEFFNEADRLVASIAKGDNTDLSLVRRDLHTLKGNCGVFAIEAVSAICHDIETGMSAEDRGPTNEEQTRLFDAWRSVSELVRGLLAGAVDDAVEVSYTELEELLVKARMQQVSNEVIELLEGLKYEPVKTRFDRVERQVAGLAERLGKCDVVVKAEHNQVRLPADRWAPFWSAFGHVVRNAVDHGLEDKGERTRTGKPERGTIALVARKNDDSTEIEIRDDGRGVDWERVRQKARSQGLPEASQQDLIEALFAEGVSSKEQVSLVSGRGVGMGAAREACLKLGGEVQIESHPGVGTTIRFVVPNEVNAQPLPSLRVARPSILSPAV